MKVTVKNIVDNKSVNLDVDETQTVESLADMLNSQFNTNDSFFFIYNKVICEADKTFTELEFIDDCVVYAAKKSDKPLKRKLDSKDLSNILTYGSFSKKSCTINGKNIIEHNVWQNKGLTEIQHELTETMLNNPFEYESLLLQSPVEQMITNPSIINSLYSAVPVLNEIIDKKPGQVKFFTDLSQYEWIQNVVSDSSELERIGLHYSQNYKNIVDSKRCKRMRDILEKTDGIKPGESETLEIPDYDEKSLAVFSQSQYVQNLTDLLSQDKELSEKVLKSCPYGQNISKQDIADIQSILPEAMNNFKKALQQSDGGNSVYKYLEEHVLEVDEEVAQRLEAVSGNLPEAEVYEETEDNAKIYEMMGKIGSWVAVPPPGGDDSAAVAKKYNKEVELLCEMGFADNGVAEQMLMKEYGSVNRAAISLASSQ